MKNVNMCAIAGNLVKDANLTKSVLVFTVAVNTSQKIDGEWQDYPNYIDCVVFGNFADAIAEKLKKGTKVFVQGSLHQDRWKDEQQNYHSRVSIYVDNIEITPNQKASETKKYKRV